jgi:hypothetical protein
MEPADKLPARGTGYAARDDIPAWAREIMRETPLSNHDKRWLYPPRQPGERSLNGMPHPF